MEKDNDIDLNQQPAVISKTDDTQVAEIEFDAPMEIKKISNVKGKPVEITLLLLEHPTDSNRASVFGDETGKDSVGGKLIYAAKHHQNLMISAISVQPTKQVDDDEHTN